jgi:hypothetical protein
VTERHLKKNICGCMIMDLEEQEIQENAIIKFGAQEDCIIIWMKGIYMAMIIFNKNGEI